MKVKLITRQLTAACLAMPILTACGIVPAQGDLVASPEMDAATEALYRDFPLRHMTIQSNRAVEPHAPEGTVWVTLDDGTASQGYLQGTAVDEDGKGTGPKGCLSEGSREVYCVNNIVKVDDEVRAFITVGDESCVLIGSTEPKKATRLLCDGEDRQV